MPHSLPHVITQIRASGRTTTHGAILLAEVDRLTALVGRDALGGFRVFWSNEDREWVGVSNAYPSLSYLDAAPEAALRGIIELQRAVERDAAAEKIGPAARKILEGLTEALDWVIRSNREAGAYDPPGSEGMRAHINALTAALVEIRDRAPLDIQEISERIVGKRETANV